MDRYTPMMPMHEAGPNPLRPYYRPPSIGVTTPPQTNSTKPTGAFPGISLEDVIGSGGDGPSTMDAFRNLLDQLMWKYTSVFLAQPFEVARMVLQVRLAGDELEGISELDTPSRGRDGRKRPQIVRTKSGSYRARIEMEDNEDDEEEEEMSYFTSTAPEVRNEPRPASAEQTPTNSRKTRKSIPAEDGYSLDLRRADSLMDVLGQMWQVEGAWGVWKGTNVTFLHAALLRALESWLRGMFAAILNVPDPGVVVSAGGLGGVDILDSPAPLAALGIAVTAAGVAGVVLAPLDAARTRIMTTRRSGISRTTLSSLNAMTSWTCPSMLVIPTILNSALPTFIATSTPLFLRAYLHIDPIISPFSYSLSTFAASVFELFAKLPFETVLRRAHLAHISQSTSSQFITRDAAGRPRLATPSPTVVPVGPYTGVIATMWRIAREEGVSYERTGAVAAVSGPGRARKGQGMHGLWRGWRVGFWALVGMWTTAAMGSSGRGEF